MTEMVKKRHPAVAALLSLVVMGLGQLYNGQLRRAVGFFALEVLGSVADATILAFLLSFNGIMIFYAEAALFTGIRIFSVIDAFVGARRVGEIELLRYNRWSVYVSILLLMAIIRTNIMGPYSASYQLSSDSMLPALLPGDILLADKKAYLERVPERGDVVVFKLPRDNETDYIKRLIGLPGDKIQVLDGVLYINDRAVPRERVADQISTDRYGNVTRMPAYRETLPNGVSYEVLDLVPDGFSDNTPVYEAPEGHYFVMGDNRDNSTDSRVLSQVGYVPAANIVGRVKVVFISDNGTASWWQVWRWPQAIRFERIGREIE